MITVFTPSYNRKKELTQLYNSLLKQDYNDFEWLIVDDGSKDDTECYINKLKKEKKIKINYIYKENGGKQSAYNLGLEHAKGDIFLCIDSDDILKTNILFKIADDFKKIKKNDKVCGVIYVQSYIKDKKKIIGTEFPEDDMIIDYYSIYNKLGVKGDKLIVLKTDVAKKYKFPSFDGEKFVPEALIFNRISLKYNLLCKNIVAAHKEYLSGGYSDNYFNLVKRNPKGNQLYYKELLKFNSNFYNIYAYILFGFFSNKTFREIIGESDNKIKVILLLIPTFIIYKKRR